MTTSATSGGRSEDPSQQPLASELASRAYPEVAGDEEDADATPPTRRPEVGFLIIRYPFGIQVWPYSLDLRALLISGFKFQSPLYLQVPPCSSRKLFPSSWDH